jgi:hypothetical protein
MPIRDNNYEKLPLELKTIEVFKIKNLKQNIMYEREYNATKTENKLATHIHHDIDGLYGIRPTLDFWSPIDFIMYNKKLNLELYIELKDRQIEDKYDTLMIGKSKVCMIIDRELYPTYVVNNFKDACYVYVIEDDDFLIQHKRNDKNIYVPKSICFRYDEFINKLLLRYFNAYNYHQLNCNIVTP